MRIVISVYFRQTQKSDQIQMNPYPCLVIPAGNQKSIRSSFPIYQPHLPYIAICTIIYSEYIYMHTHKYMYPYMHIYLAER